MADKEEKKKKKKSKKKEEAPPPAPEPEPEPAPAPAPAEEEWPPKFSDEAPAEPPAEGEPALEGEGAPPAEGEEPLPEGEGEEPPPIERRKSPYPVFWNRPKAKMYRMNFDYGENYYRSMLNYLDHKSSIGGRVGEPPRAECWAERAHKSATMRYPKQDSDISDLLHTVRSNINGYDLQHKRYTTSVQNVYGPKAY